MRGTLATGRVFSVRPLFGGQMSHVVRLFLLLGISSYALRTTADEGPSHRANPCFRCGMSPSSANLEGPKSGDFGGYGECAACCSGDAYRPNKCEILPLPDHQVSFRIDGEEKVRWHFGSQYPRPFFFPLNGPSGEPLTRMGHPGAQNHDHHRSIWFAHHSVDNTSFWSDTSAATIRQKYWYRYRDGDEEAVMASCLGWFDAEGTELLEQDMIAALRPINDDQHALEIQLTLRPPSGRPAVTLQKTNFGLLAVRVASSLSVYFGGGQLSDSEGRVGEPAIFGQQARWMDYSGPVAVGSGPERAVVTEGITYFDHPDNPRYPTFWHVREDGWMGASYNLQADQLVSEAAPLTLRYLLWAHSGPHNARAAADVHAAFVARPGFQIRKPKTTERHRQYEVERLSKKPASTTS